MKKQEEFIASICKIMKISCMQMLVWMVTSTAIYAHTLNAQELLSRKISISLENAQIKTALHEMEKKSGVRFVYSSKMLPVARRVSVSFEDKTIAQALEELFKPDLISYNIVSGKIALRISRPLVNEQIEDLPGIETPGLTREHTVTGTVKDENGEGLPGVSIMIKDTQRGTTTDTNGAFSIEIPNDNAVLIFSFVGYLNQEIVAGNRSSLNVSMQVDQKALEEVVVVGYGTQRRSDLTGSVSSVSGKDLQRIAVPRMDQALQGQTPGVQITNVQSNPGGEVSIRIRGQNSISGSNDPLIVIDGILGGDLRMISPQDIESLEVLKDASATAIYGSRGSNGVILVTTKRGKTGAPRIDISTYYAMQKVRKLLPLLNARQQREVLQGFPANLQTQLGIPGILASVDPSVDTDWQREVMQDAPQHEHQVSISGGTEKTRYSVMGSFFSQDGIVKNSGFKRGSLRVNLDQDITDKLKMGVSLNLARFHRDNLSLFTEVGSDGGNVVAVASMFPPTRPVFDRDGSYSRPLDVGAQMNNPLALVNERPNISKRNFIQGALFADYDMTKHLRFRTNFAYTNTDNLGQSYASKLLLEALGQGIANISNSSIQDWLFENTLTYSRTLAGIHSLSAMGGFTVQGIEQFNSSINGRGFSTEVNHYNSINQAEVINANSSFSDERQASYLGRINYSLKDKYLLTVNIRADGSSKFARENKWAVFPSAAVGWKISEEHFMRGLPAVSNLKLRVSWGKVGSQAINPYQSLASFSTITNAYSWGETIDVVGVGAGRVPNPYLRWETTAQTNVGIDMGLFNDRINLAADIYEKTTHDLLYGRQLPYYTGYDAQTDNIGSIRNRGFELGINTVNTTGALRWTTNANISLNRNKVLSLGEDKQFFQSAIGTLGWARQEVIVRVGEPLGTFYGYTFDGIYQNNEEVAAVDHPGSKPGTVKFRDINGDGRINTDDQDIIGNPNPDFIYGVTNNFTYKSFDISVFIQGVKGGDVLNLTRARLESPGLNNSLESSLNYWRGEGTSNTIQALGEYNGGMSTRWLEDGSYLRLKNIVIGYNLPGSAVQKLKMRSLRIYLSGVNLLTLTKYSGYDPEVNYKGDNSLQMNIDHGGFPVFKTFTAGLNIGI